MSRLLIKIVSESFDGNPLRQMGGLSGLNYDFNWHQVLGQFIYIPKSQEEIDDILAVNWACKNFPWRFSVCLADGIDLTPITDKAPKQVFVTSIPPFVKPEHYSTYPAEDLVELARSSGFSPEGDITDTGNLLRQLHAYFVGRAFSIERERQLASEVEEMKHNPVLQATTPAVITPKPKLTLAERAAMARDAKAKKAAGRNGRTEGGIAFKPASVPRVAEMATA